MKRYFLWLMVVTVCLPYGLSPARAQSQPGAAGRWEGHLDIQGNKLGISVELKQSADGAWAGTIDIPAQGAKGLPLTKITADGPNVSFAIQNIPGDPTLTGKLSEDGNTIAGTLAQGGMSFPFTLERKSPVASAAKALPAGMIPREVLFGNPERASPQLSPDGTKLGYLAPDSNGVLNVWVRTVGKTDDQVVTADKKRGIRSFGWQYDSEHIVYIQDRDGDENWHYYQTNLKTKATRDLTPFEGIQARLVAADPNFPDQVLAGLNIRDRRFHDVYRINLKNGAVELDTENPGDVVGWVVDHQLQVRVAQVFSPDGGTIIRIRDNAQSPWKEFQKWGADESFGGVAGFTPDNKGVWIISSVNANAARLLEVELATGKGRVMAEDPQYDISGAMTNPQSKKLEAVVFTRARSEWQIIDPSIKADFDALRRVRDGDFNIGSRDLADKTWLVSFVEDDAPVYYYAYNRATKNATLLFSNRPKLEQYKLAEMKPVSFKARDGMTVYGYLTLPRDKEPKGLPMVLNVHGGPWGRDGWGLNSEAQWLANRGYAVLQINFRGSTGYGKAYLNAGDREWAGKMHTDLLDGKNWAIEQGYADPKKVCIYGGSYGGYATLVGVAFTPDEFACGVDIVGPSNIVSLIKSIPPYWATIKAVFDKRVGKVETDEEFLKSRSPLFKADQIKAPLLIAQGANDPRVNKAESDQIVAAMRKNNKPVEYLVFPDEGHGFARPENRLKFYAAAEQFLAKYLGGTAEPPSDNERWDDLKK
jgi:dipeptidyl aminopeptidase/acylaminoacyl peptidase